MPRAKKLTKIEFAKSTVRFLNLAYKDYVAARVLVNEGLLPQGAVLASTAVEKYFKSILAFRGNESKGHLSKRHIRSAVNFDARISNTLNMSFLELLQKAYEIRYLDSLPDDFNLVIAFREFLAELDHTAITIQRSFNIQFNDQDVTFSFDVDAKSGKSHLMLNNHILQHHSKSKFIAAQPQQVYELRKCPIRGILEVNYVSLIRESDGQFLREGFRQLDAESMNYQVALPPILPPDDAT